MTTAPFVMPSRSFYFVRHGESAANAANQPAGILDTPLTARGRDQAAAMTIFLDRLTPPPARIVTSTLSRAIDTAAIMNAGRGYPVSQLAGLREQDYGVYAGQDKEGIKAAHGALWYENPPGGEKFLTFQQRVLEATRDVLGADITLPLIVGHGGMLIALREFYKLDLYHIKNCEAFFFHAEEEGGGCPWKVYRYKIEGEAVDRSLVLEKAAA